MLKQHEDTIIIKISDNGIGIRTEELELLMVDLKNFDSMSNRASIGLRNVNERIKLIYGTNCGINVESLEGQGTTVTLKIFAKTKEELIKHVQSFDRR
jgi:two-component system sensor histidine kinase YesM